MKKGKYRHYKGNLYEIIDVAKHSETLEKMIIYKSLSNNSGIWVRPYEMFFENIEKDGRTQKRFEFIEE